MDTTSEPEPGSLIARAPMCSPLINWRSVRCACKKTRVCLLTLGRYLSFCLSFPFRTIWLTHRFECAPFLNERQNESILIINVNRDAIELLTIAEGNSSRGSAQLLHCNDMSEISEARTSILLCAVTGTDLTANVQTWRSDSEQPHIAQSLPKILSTIRHHKFKERAYS